MTLSIPSFRKSYQRIRFEMFANRTISFLHYAQEYAAKRSDYVIYLNIYKNKSKLVIKLPHNEKKKLIIPDEFIIDANISKMIFYGYGDILIYDESGKDTIPSGWLSLDDKYGRSIKIKIFSTGSIVFSKESIL